uniref:CSON014743 protein n=1 Tax=Culicoides sonorensis TaxID=179676 RepID=A0A336MBN7_CULSO
MAQLITVRLTRNDNQPWGFRLQGGKDFGSPLALQKVNVGSIADKAGLLAGDALIKVNNEELFNLRHKDAQDAIVRAGASFELTVSRGGSTWKPAVTPLTSPVPTSAGVNVLTKTSLQAKPGQNPAAIGTGHNTAARPFASKEPSVKSVVNKQYNSPVAMYSDETIAETLSAQTEVLAGGVLGVNFKKNEKVYNSAQSEVFKMLQEQGNEPEPARPSSVYSPSSHFPQHPLNDQHSSVSDGVTKHVTAPVNVPKPPSNNGLPPGQNICADCERLIVGVFVRIKDKNLHVECFKCSTCGSSLKNQGYYNFNNKLYCDIHAKLAAMSSPPPNTNGLVPVTVPPKAPTSTISSALNAHAGALNGSSVAPAVPTTAHCVTVEIAWATPSHSRTSSMSSGYGNSNSSLKNSPIVQSPSHSRQSSGVSLSDLKLIDNLDGSNSQQVSDEEKESEISGNLYYKTINGGIIRSVKPPNKNNGEFKYKLPSSISGPKPFSYAPVPAPAPVSAPKSPIAYPPPAAPAWTAPVSAPVQTAPAWTPAPAPVNEAAKAPAAQQLQGKLNVFRQPQPQSQAPTATPKRVNDRFPCKNLPAGGSPRFPCYKCKSQPSIEIDSVVPEQQQQQQQQPQQQEEVKEEPQTVQNQSVSEEAQNQQQQQVQESLNNSRRASINQTQEEQLTQRKVSQVEQQVRLQQQVEQQSYASQSETMRRGSIQDRQSKFEQPVQQETIQQQAPKQSPPKQQQEQQQPQETSELDKEVQDTVAPRIRIVEPRWRTPSRQYLHEFEASSSSGQQNEVFSSDPNEMLRPTTPSSRPWTPSSRSQHRSSHIPYYQEQLAWEEGVALSKEFEKKLRTPSPNPMMMRPKSPAFGPPPNPLLLIHPQTRDEGKDLSGKYLSGTKLLSPMWETQHYKNEYLGVDTDNPYYEKQQKSSSQKYYESPEMIQRQRVGDTQVETRARESHAEQQKKAEMERSSVQQVGNATIQRKTRVVEEFEHTSSAKTVEVQKTKGATLTIQDDEFPPRGFVAQQARRLSTADSDTTSNNITKRQVGGGQEPRDYTVPTFQSQVSVQQQSSSQMQSYSAQSNTTNSQISQYSFPTQSGMVPPPGFPTSAQASQITNVIQRQQQQAASSFNTNTTNKATLPQPQQATNNNSDRQSNNLPSSLNNNNKNYEPSPISSSNTNPSKKTSSDPVPGLGGISGKPYNVQNVTQPKRGRGILNQAAVGRAPVCGCCSDIKPMKMVGNPTEMLEQSVRELKLNNGKPSSKFKNDASQVISAMLEARLKLTQPKPLQKEIPLPPLPKSSPPKHDTVTLHSSINNKLRNMKKLNENIGEEREKLDEKILSIIPTTTEVDVFVKRNSINNNNNNKSHASNRLSYVETFNNNNNKIDTNDKENEKINKNSAETNNKIVNGIQNGELPICCKCNVKITTGPFITALGRIWCPEHFICVNANCKRPLADIGFVEEKGDLYCEYCFEQYLAPNCSKCVKKIKGDCLNAIGRQFHPECFTCSYCGKLFGNSPFFLEEGEPYCQNDWNELFTTKCFACGFPVEAGDRWVEALNNNYHSQCFNCTMCKKNLEGQSFYAKGGRPFCKNHAQYNYLKKKTQFIINLNISKYFNTITHIMYVNNKIKTILKFKFKH